MPHARARADIHSCNLSSFSSTGTLRKCQEVQEPQSRLILECFLLEEPNVLLLGSAERVWILAAFSLWTHTRIWQTDSRSRLLKRQSALAKHWGSFPCKPLLWLALTPPIVAQPFPGFTSCWGWLAKLLKLHYLIIKTTTKECNMLFLQMCYFCHNLHYLSVECMFVCHWCQSCVDG